MNINRRNQKATFNGMRSVRFPPIKETSVDPTVYEYQKVKYFNDKLEKKPHSIHGVIETLEPRLPYMKQKHNVAPCDHDTTPSLILDPIKVIDYSKKSSRYDFGSHSTTPAPNTYDINYVTGRHGANNYKFQLLKSNENKERDKLNKTQLETVNHLLKLDNIFTDKKTCRRIGYFALYYPQRRIKEKNEH
ncbi:hypothetical protein H8356DRAFT_1055000 [Neocallimastix lanati (nom. inval.)]|uniref:Uncharacterized protein n=1 Tax=Neocallimastix californiae TaxID=1754190 RepID=A0A1Y2F071_9FUNG|nr:hypothetical protein H8356DRAFT_1055000 [Neocallimastix sp. JGI-2020a]ORY77107.1 hypothetical protein LY90DRAFT_501493 [Neocallimastix californiae]|eukprot:ORY77107.1 hypothetical protein LY90DRAFT_501493 [Neocallimastix californiae]